MEGGGEERGEVKIEKAWRVWNHAVSWGWFRFLVGDEKKENRTEEAMIWVRSSSLVCVCVCDSVSVLVWS